MYIVCFVWYNIFIGDREIYVTLIYWNGGDCSDTLKKGVFGMDSIIELIILIIILEIIKNIKK